MARHGDGSLYERPFDFPDPVPPVRLDYMVASIPRSGSTYFASALWRRGSLGAPMEYLNLHINRARVTERYGGDLAAYWRDIRSRRTSPNGVFGWKMFMGTYRQLSEEHPELLEQLAPSRVIYFDREDRHAHAVSYWRAMLTQAWFKEAPERVDPDYDFDGIRRAHEFANDQRKAWNQVFTLTGTDPLRITYEELLADPDTTFVRIKRHLDVGDEVHEIDTIPLPILQRDEHSIAWADRYRSETDLA